MYGTPEKDPVVRYYDDTLGIGAKTEIPWFVRQAEECGSPVLDLGCGTGRIAIPLARTGFEVIALDNSKGMLEVFRHKLEEELKEVRERITIRLAPMHDFKCNRTFATVVCCDTFFHNLTVEEQFSCLRCVKNHLKPEGHFVFNLPNPTLEFLQNASSPEGQKFRKRDEYPFKGNDDTILVEQKGEADLLTQIVTTTLRFTRFNSKQEVTESSESSWKIRYLFKYEAIHLLYRCGFEIISLTGNYKGVPVKEKSQLIFITKRAMK